VRLVRESLVHGRGIKIPHGCPAHNIQSEGAIDGKIHGCVELLHESGLLGARLDAPADGKRSDESLHEELAREGEDDGVEGNEGEVACALAILDGRGGVCARLSRERVREEEGGGEGVLGRRIDEVERDEGEGQREGPDPRVPHANPLVFGEGAADRPALRTAAGFLALGMVSTSIRPRQQLQLHIQSALSASRADSLASQTQAHSCLPAAQRPVRCFSAAARSRSCRPGSAASTAPSAAGGKARRRGRPS
jgi:hypothetical protein